MQRRHGVLGFPYAVVKKYGDDEGGRHAALITYYGFLSIFPLLLLGVAILSRVLADHPDLRRRLIDEIVPKALRPAYGRALAGQLATPTIPFVVSLRILMATRAGMRATLLSRQPWRDQECTGLCASLWMNCANTQDGGAMP
jgi:membrane protein